MKRLAKITGTILVASLTGLIIWCMRTGYKVQPETAGHWAPYAMTGFYVLVIWFVGSILSCMIVDTVYKFNPRTKTELERADIHSYIFGHWPVFMWRLAVWTLGWRRGERGKAPPMYHEWGCGQGDKERER